jgi:hypothetical protein
MEVSLLDKTSLKFKSKSANLIVDPFDKLSKTQTDGVIILSSEGADLTKVTDYRVVIKSAGEYEVGGIKVTGISIEGNTVYDLRIDNVNVILSRTSFLNKISDKIKEYDVAIFNVDSEINQTVVTALEPSVVILYGDNTTEAVKSLGVGNVVSSQKYSVTEDKLPEEMQVVLLK